MSGKKVGRTIGIPTSILFLILGNLEFDPKILRDHSLIPGVYYGTCKFTSKNKYDFLTPFLGKVDRFHNKEMKAVISLGTNIQYQDMKLKLEVMILEDIPNQEFYGECLETTLLGFIRPEAYFPSFSCFIKAMENDIYVAKTMLYQTWSKRHQTL